MLAALGLAGCGTKTITRTVTVDRPGSTVDQRYFGHVVSMQRSGAGYLMRFDPEWFLSGLTGNVALAEDSGTTCKPRACPPVPNDVYSLDETHRALTFVVPASTMGAVLVGGGLSTKKVDASELAQIVAGHSSLKLFEPLDSGVWITVHIDTVRRFDQQYRP